jgi:hypothetical protein
VLSKADVPDPPGDGLERLDRSTLFWTESGSSNEFGLCFLGLLASRSSASSPRSRRRSRRALQARAAMRGSGVRGGHRLYITASLLQLTSSYLKLVGFTMS